MEMTVYEFFDNVWGGELGEIDINNYISKTTDNYDVRKLRLLKKDIEYCFSCAQEEIDAEYTQQDVENALNELQKKYNEIPDYVYITTPVPVVPFNKDNAGKVIFKEKKIINKEQLLYPYEFFNVRRLIGLIDRLIELYDIPEPTQPGTPKPLTPPPPPSKKTFWKPNNKKSLIKFFDLLNDYGYIDKISKEVFISHFDGTATPGTPKINWIDEQIVLIRLFDNISFCINVMFLPHKYKTVSTEELSKHFTINGNETTSLKLRQSRYTIKNGIDTKKENEITKIRKELEKIFSTVD